MSFFIQHNDKKSLKTIENVNVELKKNNLPLRFVLVPFDKKCKQCILGYQQDEKKFSRKD